MEMANHHRPGSEHFIELSCFFMPAFCSVPEPLLQRELRSKGNIKALYTRTLRDKCSGIKNTLIEQIFK
jgi:hypothetical protein